MFTVSLNSDYMLHLTGLQVWSLQTGIGTGIGKKQV